MPKRDAFLIFSSDKSRRRISFSNYSLNKSIKYVKIGKVKEAEKALRPAVNQLIKKNVKKLY